MAAFSPHYHFLKKKFTYLVERQNGSCTERGKEEEWGKEKGGERNREQLHTWVNFPFVCSLPKCMQPMGLGNTAARSITI